MRARQRHADASGVEVMLSPLIDCVFLLLIFFLVTSMIKRYERQIPVRLMDRTAAVSMTATEPAQALGIDESGALYRSVARNSRGAVQFERVDDAQVYLNDLLAVHGPSLPLELVVERDTPFQRVIRTLDEIERLGFERVTTRVRDRQL